MSTILVRTDLCADPRVIRMASECGVGVHQIVGSLVWLWSLAQTQSHGGNLRHLTASLIDQQTGTPGFSKAAQTVEWLRMDDDGAHIPDFDRYFGASSKTRAQERIKKARQRWNKPRRPKKDGDIQGTQPGQEGDTTGTARKHQSGADQTRPEQTVSDQIRADRSQPDQTGNTPPAAGAESGSGSAGLPLAGGGSGSGPSGMGLVALITDKQTGLRVIGVQDPAHREFMADNRVTVALIRKVARQRMSRNGEIKNPAAWAVGAIKAEVERSGR